MSKTLTVYLAADLKKFNSGMDDASRKAQGLGGTMSNMLGPALAGAAVAAGAFAVKLGVDGVKAAVEDEASIAKLSKSLDNLNMSHDTEAVEDFIGSLERSYGVADSDLRPAYESLARATGSVEEANKALSLALDVSSGSGKSLDATVTALSRAYQGNTAGLSRLNAGIDAATLKSGDMQAITEKLSDTFGGAAKTQAQTYAGQLQRVQVAAENLQEAFGRGVLRALGDTENQTSTLTQTMADFEPVLESLGEEIGLTAGYIVDVIGPLSKLTTLLEKNTESTGLNDVALNALRDSIYNLGNVWKPLSGVINTVTGSTEAATEADVAYTSATVEAALQTGKLTTSVTDLTPALEENKTSALDAAGSYVTLYEKIAEADRIARDFANTSGTVSSAIASGFRNPQFTPNTRAADTKAPEPAPLPIVTEQVVAQAINNLVAKSDARSGIAPNIPRTGMGVVFR